MYRVTGKQRFGAVWANGKCLAVFRNGEALVSTAAAEALRARGYRVEEEPAKKKSEGGRQPCANSSKRCSPPSA